MSFHDLVETTSGPLIILLAAAAVAAFVAADLLTTTHHGGRARRLAHRCTVVAWPLSIATLVLAVVRLTVLA